jgi:SOS response regulatory protein OraA/RecX
MKPGEHPEFDDALSAALHMLRGRDRFESEIRAGVTARAEVLDQAIEYLRSRKFLNDFRTARNLAFKWSHAKSWSKGRIAHELNKRGAADDAIAEAVAALPEDEAVAGRLARYSRLEGRKLARKLSAAGFDEETIERFVAS